MASKEPVFRHHEHVATCSLGEVPLVRYDSNDDAIVGTPLSRSPCRLTRSEAVVRSKHSTSDEECTTVAYVSTRTAWGLSLTFVVVQCAIAVAAIWLTQHVILPSPKHSAWHVLPIVVALSQGPLLGYWVAFGGRLAPLRLVVVTCLVAGNAHFLTAYSPRVFATLSYGYAIQPLFTSMLFLGMRFMGLRVERLPLEPPSSRQFSLLRLFFWIAVVAVMLTILRSTPEIVKLFSIFATYGVTEPGMFVEIGSFAILAGAALWTALGSHKPMLRIITFAGIIEVCLAIYRLLGQENVFSMIPSRILFLFAGYPVLLVFWFLGFRLLGYRARFVRRVPASVETA